MYIRYFDGTSEDDIAVRDIRYFCVQACEWTKSEGDGAKVSGYCLFDKMAEREAEFAGLIVSAMASRLSTAAQDEKQFLPIGSFWKERRTRLACFTSKNVALAAFNDICQALADGKQYFDLIPYDERH